MKAWQIEFGRSARPSIISWLLLVLGASCMAYSAHAYIEAQDAKDHIAQLRSERLREIDAAAEKAALSKDFATPAFTQDKRWLHASAELKAPWMRTLTALEQTTKQPIFLMGIKVDHRDGRIQLDAEADSFEAMLAYIKVLQEDPSFYGVRLLRHEQGPDAVGRPSTHFSIESHWVALP